MNVKKLPVFRNLSDEELEKSLHCARSILVNFQKDEYISVSNGVIILDGKDEICYGGDLKVMSDDFANITTYSTTIYINGSEKETLLSNGVDDQTGETIDVSGNVGQISGDILRDSDADKLTDNLWFELKTTNLNGEESTYRVQLETTEITKEVKK